MFFFQTLIDVKNPLLCREIQSGQKSAGYARNGVRRASDRKSDMRRPDASLFYHFSPLSSAHAQVPISICRRFRLRAGNLCFCSEPAINLAFRAERSLWRHRIRCFVLLLKQNTRSRLLPTYSLSLSNNLNAWRTSRWRAK